VVAAMNNSLTGIVRQVDELGRIVIPKPYRYALNIGAGTEVEMFAQGNQLIVRRYAPACVFCSSEEDTIEHHGLRACAACVGELGAKVGCV